MYNQLYCTELTYSKNCRESFPLIFAQAQLQYFWCKVEIDVRLQCLLHFRYSMLPVSLDGLSIFDGPLSIL